MSRKRYIFLIFKGKGDTVYYSTQDGVSLDEDFVEKIQDKLENMFDSLEDVIENELEVDSDESLGKTLFYKKI